MHLQKVKTCVNRSHYGIWLYNEFFYYSSMYIVVEYSLIVVFLILDVAVSQELVAPRSRL